MLTLLGFWDLQGAALPFVVVLFGCLVFQVEEVKKMKIGDPLDRSTDHGPQNHKAHLDKLVEYCQNGVKEGATLVCGGKQVQRPGKAMLSVLKLDSLVSFTFDMTDDLLNVCLQAFSLNPRCLLMLETTCSSL